MLDLAERDRLSELDEEPEYPDDSLGDDDMDDDEPDNFVLAPEYQDDCYPGYEEREREVADLLNDFYTVDDPRVYQYLLDRGVLFEFLLQAHRDIARFFPQSHKHNRRLSLNAIDLEYLVLHIVVYSDDQTAAERLARMDEEWWIEAGDCGELSALVIDTRLI